MQKYKTHTRKIHWNLFRAVFRFAGRQEMTQVEFMVFLRNKLPGVMKWCKSLNSVCCDNVMEKSSIVADPLSKSKQTNSHYSMPCVQHRVITVAQFSFLIGKHSVLCLQHLSQHEYTPFFSTWIKISMFDNLAQLSLNHHQMYTVKPSFLFIHLASLSCEKWIIHIYTYFTFM